MLLDRGHRLFLDPTEQALSEAKNYQVEIPEEGLEINKETSAIRNKEAVMLEHVFCVLAQILGGPGAEEALL
jgi:hypothetical protein